LRLFEAFQGDDDFGEEEQFRKLVGISAFVNL
jgi:hypothetical protein